MIFSSVTHLFGRYVPAIKGPFDVSCYGSWVVSQVALGGADRPQPADLDSAGRPRAPMGVCRSRTNSDDRLPADPLGRIEGRDGMVEGRDVARTVPATQSGPASPLAPTVKSTNLNDDVIYRCLRLGPLRQLHPGRSRSLVRYHDRLHVHCLPGYLSLCWICSNDQKSARHLMPGAPRQLGNRSRAVSAKPPKADGIAAVRKCSAGAIAVAIAATAKMPVVLL